MNKTERSLNHDLPALRLRIYSTSESSEKMSLVPEMAHQEEKGEIQMKCPYPNCENQLESAYGGSNHRFLYCANPAHVEAIHWEGEVPRNIIADLQWIVSEFFMGCAVVMVGVFVLMIAGVR